MNDRARGLSWLLLLVGFSFREDVENSKVTLTLRHEKSLDSAIVGAAAAVNWVADFEVHVGLQLGLTGMKVN